MLVCLGPATPSASPFRFQFGGPCPESAYLGIVNNNNQSGNSLHVTAYDSGPTITSHYFGIQPWLGNDLIYPS
jgi:hypothetical protein